MAEGVAHNKDVEVHVSEAVVQKGDCVLYVEEARNLAPTPSTEPGYALQFYQATHLSAKVGSVL